MRAGSLYPPPHTLRWAPATGRWSEFVKLLMYYSIFIAELRIRVPHSKSVILKLWKFVEKKRKKEWNIKINNILCLLFLTRISVIHKIMTLRKIFIYPCMNEWIVATGWFLTFSMNGPNDKSHYILHYFNMGKYLEGAP